MKRTSNIDAIRRSLIIVALIALSATCYVARDFLLPIVLGFLIALTLSPATRGLARIGVPYWVSAVGLIGATAIAISATIYFSSGTILGWMDNADEMRLELQTKLSGVFRQLEQVREASKEVADIAGSNSAAQEVVIRPPTPVNDTLSVVGGIGFSLAVALALAGFLLASGHTFYIKILQSVQTLGGKKRALSMVHDIERRVSRYLLTIALINASLGICVGLALAAIGMPNAHILGTAAFLLNFLPYVGALIGVALVAALSILTFDSLSHAALAPAAYLTLNALEGNFVTPTLLGQRLELNTVAVFLTVVTWGWLWGIPGALVAVPVLIVFKVVADNVEGMEVASNFLGAAPPSHRS